MRIRRDARNFLLFLMFSLLLHTAAVTWFIYRERPTETPVDTPFFVELQEDPRAARRPAPDLAVARPVQPAERERPARRSGLEDRVAKRESAPRGDDDRDSDARPEQNLSERTATGPPGGEKVTPQALAAETPRSETLKIPAIPLDRLLGSGENAAKKIAQLDPEISRRTRREVDEGKAVWLDTEKDLLGSFYKRFRDGIYLVWTYPAESAERGESGVCLYRIVVNRAGVVVGEPELLKSSGFSRLDRAAVQAVREASPRFGYLPDAYPYETLTIFAWFDYRIGSKPVIYGERRMR